MSFFHGRRVEKIFRCRQGDRTDTNGRAKD
jgi:hypothetical protein